MNHTLVDQALEKAQKAEKEGNQAEVVKWLEVAEKAEKLYEKVRCAQLKVQNENIYEF